MRNEDVLVFSSEKEKEKYIEFLKKEYYEEKTNPFEETKTFIEDRTSNIKRNGLPMSELLLYGFLCIVHFALLLSGVEIPLLFNIIGRIAALECCWQINRGLYRAIIPTTVITPFVFSYNLVSGIIKNQKLRKKIRRIKKQSVIEEINHDDEKNSQEMIVNGLIREVSNNKNSYYGYTLDEVINVIERIKENVIKVKNDMMKESYINNLYIICTFILRALKLSDERREEALKYTLDQLHKMEDNVNSELYSEGVQEEVKEEDFSGPAYRYMM
jgi:hypothetical protein